MGCHLTCEVVSLIQIRRIKGANSSGRYEKVVHFQKEVKTHAKVVFSWLIKFSLAGPEVVDKLLNAQTETL